MINVLSIFHSSKIYYIDVDHYDGLEVADWSYNIKSSYFELVAVLLFSLPLEIYQFIINVWSFTSNAYYFNFHLLIGFNISVCMFFVVAASTFIRNYYFLQQFLCECVFMSVCVYVFVCGCELGRTNVNFICIKWSKNETNIKFNFDSFDFFPIIANNALINMGHTIRICDRINRVASNSALLADWFRVYFGLHSSHIKRKEKSLIKTFFKT